MEGHAGEVVEPVNFNAPAQVVIAGHKAAVERACVRPRRSAPSARCRCRCRRRSIRRCCGRRASGWPARWRSARLRCAAHRAGQQRRRRGRDATPRASSMRWCARRTRPVRWVEVVSKLSRDGRRSRDRVRAGQGAGRPGRADRQVDQGAARSTTRPALEAALTELGMRRSRRRRRRIQAVALVTGASRGIGRAIALELGRQGATVIGTATTAEGAAGIGEALRPGRRHRPRRRAERHRCRGCEQLVDDGPEGVRRTCRSWSTTPASRATTSRCG